MFLAGDEEEGAVAAKGAGGALADEPVASAAAPPADALPGTTAGAAGAQPTRIWGPLGDAAGAVLHKVLSLPQWVLDGEGYGSAKERAGQGGIAERQVILRMEYLSSTQTKLLTAISFCFFAAAMLALVTEALLKFKLDPTRVLVTSHTRFFIASLVISTTQLGLLAFVLAHFSLRLWVAARSGRAWSRRRKRISMLSFAQLLARTLNTTLWVVLSALLLDPNCSWNQLSLVLLGCFMWTLWNCEFLLILVVGHSGNVWRGGRWFNSRPVLTAQLGEAPGGAAAAASQDRLVLDAPLTIHTLKLLPWAAMQTMVCLLSASVARNINDVVLGSDCQALLFTCNLGTTTTTYIGVAVGCVAVYLGLYYIHMVATFRMLRRRPYRQMRLSNLLHRIQVRQVATVFGAMALSIIFLLLVKLESCWTFIFAWFGIIPAQVAAAGMSIVTAWYFMPSNPRHPNNILRVWLQEVAWSTSSLPECLARRNQHLAGSRQLALTSMFCVETAMRLLYWSNWVYYYEELPDSPVDEEFALKMFGLEGLDLVWDRGQDIKAMVAWRRAAGDAGERKEPKAEENGSVAEQGSHAKGCASSPGAVVLIAFRGTASMENMKTNLRLYQTVHPPARRIKVPTLLGLLRLWRTPKVHAGFWQAWAGVPPPSSAASSAGSAPKLGLQSQRSNGVQVEGLQAAQQQQQQQQRGAENGREVRCEEGHAQRGAPSETCSTAGAADMPFNQALLKRVEEVLEEQGIQPEGLTFYLTGHSLGGALASLAALELIERYPGCRMVIYTYGSPRLGNRPFAVEYDTIIRDHWAVVCDQDPVPRVPKGTYKRCGSRAVVSAGGDLIVRPTFLETSILKGTGVVGDHQLERYRGAFAAVLKAQFTTKRLQGGQQAVEELCCEADLDKLLLCEGLDLASLRDETKRPATWEALERQAQERERSVHGGLLNRAFCMPCTACSAPPSKGRLQQDVEAGSGDYEVIQRHEGRAGQEPAVAAATEAAGGQEPAAPLVEMSPHEDPRLQAAAVAAGGGGVVGKAAAALCEHSRRTHSFSVGAGPSRRLSQPLEPELD